MRKATLALVCLGVAAFMVAQSGYAKVTAKDATAVWLLDEGTGDTVKDLSGNGNGGKLTGPTKWTDGKFGKGVELDVNARVASTSAKGVGGTFLSECLWIKFSDFANESQFGYIRATGTGSPRYFYFSTWSAAGAPHNSVHLGTLDTKGNWGRGIATGKMFDAGQWYFVCGVIDNKEGVTKAYVNGEQKHTQPFDKGDTPGTPVDISVGGTSENYQWIKGTVDDIGFFNVALTQDDIKMLMADGMAKALGVGTSVEALGKLAATWGGLKSR